MLGGRSEGQAMPLTMGVKGEIGNPLIKVILSAGLIVFLVLLEGLNEAWSIYM